MHPDRLRQARMLALVPLLGAALMVVGTRSARASSRTWQPLIVKGAQVAALLGARIDKLEILAVRNGTLEPIPFQIDERLPDGRYALPDGPEPIAGHSPGILDRDDEIALMVSDLGGPARDAPMPAGAQQIALVDPLGGPERYAYLAATEHPRLSPRTYIEYDGTRDLIESDSYRVGFTRELPTDFALQDRRHRNRANMIDRIKVRVSARVLALFNFHIDEDDVNNRLLAWHAGPIRVIRELRHSMRLVLKIRSPEVSSQDFFYRDYVENPFQVRFPWVPRFLFGDIRVRTDLDFTNLDGVTLTWSGMRGPPLKIGDAAAERALETDRPAPQVRWIALRGGGRTIIQTLAPTTDLNVIDCRLYFRDDPSVPDPPERVRGEHPGIGYQMTGWERLGRGRHDLDSLLLVAPGDYDPDLLLRELSTPLRVTVTPAAAS